GPFNEQDVLGLTDLDDLQVLRGAAHLAQVAGHPHATHDGAGKEALSDRARAAMPPFGAVRRVAAAKRVTANHAFEPAAFGDTNGIYIIPGSKQSRAEHVARLDLFRKIAEFANAFDRRAAELFDMAQQGFRHPLLFLVVESELDGVVSIRLLGLALQHAIG